MKDKKIREELENDERKRRKKIKEREKEKKKKEKRERERGERKEGWEKREKFVVFFCCFFLSFTLPPLFYIFFHATIFVCKNNLQSFLFV